MTGILAHLDDLDAGRGPAAADGIRTVRRGARSGTAVRRPFPPGPIEVARRRADAPDDTLPVSLPPAPRKTEQGPFRDLSPRAASGAVAVVTFTGSAP